MPPGVTPLPGARAFLLPDIHVVSAPMQVLQRLAEEGGGEPGGPSTTNTLNCPRCHRVRQHEG